MKTVSINDLRKSGIESWSVKDNSPRGISTKYTSEVSVGDEVVLDNHFTLVTD